MKKIIIITESYPLTENAIGIRAFNLARMMTAAGYEALVIGLNYKLDPISTGVHLGIPYELLTFPEIQCVGIKKFKRINAKKRNICERIAEIIKDDGVYAVISSHIFPKLQRLTTENGVFLICDHVEYYSRYNFSKPFIHAQYLYYCLEKERCRSTVKNAIAISSFLKSWTEEKNAHVIRITTLTDTEMYPTKAIAEEKERLHIFYAGNIGRKDETVNVIKAIALLSEEEKKRIVFDIYGINETLLLKRYSLADSDQALLGKQVLCHGKIPHGDIITKTLDADFTVLLRKNWRNANAGFPTKLGESMSCGVPVIGNLTSDIGLYLHDGIEGLVCRDETPEACADALRRALCLSRKQLNDMRRNARAQAERSFDFRNYVEAMREYLATLKMENVEAEES